MTFAIAPRADGRPLFPGCRRFLATSLAMAYLLWGGAGQATVVERIVAVVGDRPILMSDLRARARPYLSRIQQELPTESHRAAAITQLHKQLIQQLVDEELIARAARRAKIVISEEDIAAALERVAKQNNITLARLLEEAASSGMTELQYREELRRQILEARMLNLRVQGRVRVRDEDLRAMYLSLVLEERKKLGFEAAWIVLDGRSEGATERAEVVSSRARSGEAFASLANQFSIDAASRQRGGVLGQLTPGKLPPQLDRIAQRLEVGEVSSPIRLGDRLVILRLLSRDESQLPTFEEARGELGERVYGEKMAKARRRWLEGLRGQTHVEVRL
ncbi:MAG: SurA N-terminal domain-containing protein [Polyangiaceae bacterium]